VPPAPPPPRPPAASKASARHRAAQGAGAGVQQRRRRRVSAQAAAPWSPPPAAAAWLERARMRLHDSHPPAALPDAGAAAVGAVHAVPHARAGVCSDAEGSGDRSPDIAISLPSPPLLLQREEALAAFRRGKLWLLVTTDLPLARGLNRGCAHSMMGGGGQQDHGLRR